MHSFKDKTGREWILEADLGSYDRVAASAGVKLYDIATDNPQSLVQLADVLTLGKVLWLMCEPQAESRGVSPEDFAKAFDGDTLAAAYKSLINEMVFFCPTRQRKALTLAVKKILDVETRAEEMVNENMEEFEREIDRAIENWTRGSSPTSSPESSESIPETGPSAVSSTPSEADAARTGITPALSSPN
jgi:hypothetical protein